MTLTVKFEPPQLLRVALNKCRQLLNRLPEVDYIEFTWNNATITVFKTPMHQPGKALERKHDGRMFILVSEGGQGLDIPWKVIEQDQTRNTLVKPL